MSRVLLAMNDNIQERNLYEGDVKLLPYIPVAQHLIQKYISDYWKHDCNDLDFVYMERMLCGLLSEPRDIVPRRLTLKWIARELNVSPLRLYNDPSLPF